MGVVPLPRLMRARWPIDGPLSLNLNIGPSLGQRGSEMLKRIMQWLRERRERRLYREMSRNINESRRKMTPMALPIRRNGDDWKE